MPFVCRTALLLPEQKQDSIQLTGKVDKPGQLIWSCNYCIPGVPWLPELPCHLP